MYSLIITYRKNCHFSWHSYASIKLYVQSNYYILEELSLLLVDIKIVDSRSHNLD